jgi:hypothetical protein
MYILEEYPCKDPNFLPFQLLFGLDLFRFPMYCGAEFLRIGALEIHHFLLFCGGEPGKDSPEILVAVRFLISGELKMTRGARRTLDIFPVRSGVKH